MPIALSPANPINPDFVAKVQGICLKESLSEEAFKTIQSAIDHYSVLIFENQEISDEEQFAFSRRFGLLEKATGDYMELDDRRLPMELNDISNLNRFGNLLSPEDPKNLFSLGNMLWHSDSSFKIIPAQYSILSAKVIPSKDGDTEYADMRAAWVNLDEKTQQKCLGLVTEHSQIYSRGELGFTDFREDQLESMTPVPQALVRQHPRTKKLSLYLSSHAGTIQRWPVPEARIFLKQLVEHATKREFVYRHNWQMDDLVIWDNQCTVHRGLGYDPKEVRDMRRTTVAGLSSSLTDMPF